MPDNLEIDGEGRIVVTTAPGLAFDGTGFVFTAGSDISFTIIGSPANAETLRTSVSDRVTGDDFEDTVRGAAGIDRLDTGGGNDVLGGGQAKDLLLGADGGSAYAAHPGPHDRCLVEGRGKHL